MVKEKSRKVSKGYRLKPETHELINRIQNTLHTDIDTIISAACKLLYSKIKRNPPVTKI